MEKSRRMEINATLSNLMDSDPNCLTKSEKDAIMDLLRYTIELETAQRNMVDQSK